MQLHRRWCMQVRLAALKRDEEALQKERERLEAEKMRHIRWAPAQACMDMTTAKTLARLVNQSSECILCIILKSLRVVSSSRLVQIDGEELAGLATRTSHWSWKNSYHVQLICYSELGFLSGFISVMPCNIAVMPTAALIRAI